MNQELNWIQAVQRLDQKCQPYVLATVIGTAGSTPRNIGTKMVIGLEGTFDTIGGGHFEYQVMAKARELLEVKDTANKQLLEHFPLSARVGQCCGGSVSVLLEYFPAQGSALALYGAGHVGRALVRILSGLPCHVQWVDSRAEEFPPEAHLNGSNISAVVEEFPVEQVSQMPAGSYYLVMTHNHQLDYDLCCEILKRGDFTYLGLIASRTKWKRFRQRLINQGFDEALISRIHSPVGLSDIPGKRPMEVAVSISAQVIQMYQRQLQSVSKRDGVNPSLVQLGKERSFDSV